jgi:hypothetical protein
MVAAEVAAQAKAEMGLSSGNSSPSHLLSHCRLLSQHRLLDLPEDDPCQPQRQQQNLWVGRHRQQVEVDLPWP